jgi:hypothetical protein
MSLQVPHIAYSLMCLDVSNGFSKLLLGFSIFVVGLVPGQRD